MNIKVDILWRVYLILGLLLVGALCVSGKIVKIQWVEGEQWLDEMTSTKIDTIHGKRGDIYSANNKLMATSLPYYKIAMDPLVPEMAAWSHTEFLEKIQPLCEELGKEFEDRTAKQFEQSIMTARMSQRRYLTIAQKVDYTVLKKMETWPIFKRGQHKGGFIVERFDERVRPFDYLMERTLGYMRDSTYSVGLELSFNELLKGKTAPVTKRRVNSNNWVEIDSPVDFPDDGYDVQTTIDVKVQDIAHNALLKSLEKNLADHGCAIVMEVATGKIVSIVNLGKNSQGKYTENFNYAIGEKTYPGSTFKTPMLLALLSDGKASLNSFVNLEDGVKKYHDRTMRDDHEPLENEVTLQNAFETSSNVGMSSLIYSSYREDPKQLVRRLHYMLLNHQTEIELNGEKTPFINEPGNEEWSGISPAWMAIGYEIELTPLQLLRFYNSIANNGVMMKPYLVSTVKNQNEIIQEFKPTVVKQICTRDHAMRVQSALRGVVLRGTAKGIRSDYLTMAGKTGTALMSKPTAKEKKYQASFVGYFPAENPKYSCVVVVNDPQAIGQYYGSQVAAPVFKEIAEKTFAAKVEWQTPINEGRQKKVVAGKLPETKTGFKQDIVKLYDFLEVPYVDETAAPLVVALREANQVSLQHRTAFEKSKAGEVPNVMGMGLRDALFILENKGLKVMHSGAGKVLKQSIEPGTTIERAKEIVIELG